VTILDTIGPVHAMAVMRGEHQVEELPGDYLDSKDDKVYFRRANGVAFMWMTVADYQTFVLPSPDPVPEVPMRNELPIRG
jgi:hypothetical protein